MLQRHMRKLLRYALYFVASYIAAVVLLVAYVDFWFTNWEVMEYLGGNPDLVNNFRAYFLIISVPALAVIYWYEELRGK